LDAICKIYLAALVAVIARKAAGWKVNERRRMLSRNTLIFIHALLFAGCVCAAAARGEETSDIVVYGGTGGGIVAAVQAARQGKHVTLIEPTQHLGGMTTGGLGATDTGNERAIGGVSREFYQRILKFYEQPAAWNAETPAEYKKREHYYQRDALFGFEPHVAAKIYGDMLGEAGVRVVVGRRLQRTRGDTMGVRKEGSRIVSITMQDGGVFSAKIFIDATYEGDLLAAAGVSCTIGREANSQYGETYDGIETSQAKGHQFTLAVDPFNHPGQPDSGLLPGIHLGGPGVDGDADKRVQAFNYRICMTDAAANRVPFPKPAHYDEKNYELLLRYYEAGFASLPWGSRGMPNRKTDTNNNGAFSTDAIGMADAYPEADYATRDKITAQHIEFVQGLLWTAASSPRVPEKVRREAAKWGLAKDEFADNDNWPYQLYVREARRMIGNYVMTEGDIMHKHGVADPVGLGSYNMDSHNTQRYVDAAGHVRNEGDVQIHGIVPYGISYQSLVPKEADCTNLLVPVCMSATHIAYGSIRMEPVFMILGQACGSAACIAIDDKTAVQHVPYPALAKQLLADRQILEWPAKH
jgi:hypothetical protein